MIYADNAATTKLDIDAFEAMKPFLLDEYGNASQPYSFANAAKRALKIARKTIADCIGAFPDEIYFTSGGTESDNWAIKEGASNIGKIITSRIEHHAVLNSCKTIEEAGREVVYLPVNQTGCVKKSILNKVLDNNTSLVSIMFANNEIGSIQKIKELTAIAHKHGALFHTDAVQAVGHVEIDVHEMGVDFLSASAHKFNGPKGIGFLYVKRGICIKAYLNGGNQEKGLRSGTENVASIVGMAVALKNNCDHLKENTKKIISLENILITKLEKSEIDFIRNGSKSCLPGVMNLSFRGIDGEMLLNRLDLFGICISTGAACDSKKTKISHVIDAISIPKEYADGTIRISLSKYNSEQEVEKIADSLIEIIKRYTEWMQLKQK